MAGNQQQIQTVVNSFQTAVFVQDKIVCAKSQGFGFFVRTGRDDRDLIIQVVSELDGQVTQAAHTDDSEFLRNR